ncbi:hypothetical protein [uncultured Ilyobacter sp.]|uniref:hypothetical protein n=1 Tax=uncultured Ilyobacter sp. TaxID=544433 RepID=UPI0029C081E8|nr:hypothetical protein [uncultured Ilyobacter sp.]
MFGLIQGMFENPLYGILTLVFCTILYLWKEQNRIKGELEKVEKSLDNKKLDKEDHESYIQLHKELHSETHRQTNIVLNLLEKLSGRR